ncbi:MAG: alternative ribosome rescue aminoacyl-tRNA hydrolase ArfB [Candidatus Nanopelagicales bacterium]|nr:alternative ribosome rescue aminoacyl-tRNA hydrolase ArfB [Candidatus Nanopelagicales bacterium]
MADDLVIRGAVVIPQAELVVKFSRSSGPGGQGVNTADSRVQLSYDIAKSLSLPEYLRQRALKNLKSKLVDGCITITASEQRSQLQNRRAAEQRLAQLLREAIAPPARTRKATRPTKGSVERRLNSKKSRGETKRLRSSKEHD